MEKVEWRKPKGTFHFRLCASRIVGFLRAESRHRRAGLDLFVRSLVGVNRSAAKDALTVFINGKTFTANQLEFINLIVDHLTEHGVMEAARLYESPFTDIAPYGPDDLFLARDIDELLQVLDSVRATASEAA